MTDEEWSRSLFLRDVERRLDEAQKSDGWSVLALRSHVESRIDELENTLVHRDEALAIALKAAKESADMAIMAAKVGIEERLTATAANLLQHMQHQSESTKLALENLDKVLAERDKAVTSARAEQRESLAKADEALGIRLEGMNNFRRQIEGERGDYVRKDYFSQTLTSVERRSDERFSLLGTRLDGFDDDMSTLRSDLQAVIIRQATEDRGKGDGRERISLYFAGAGVFISAVLSVVAIILHFI